MNEDSELTNRERYEYVADYLSRVTGDKYDADAIADRLEAARIFSRDGEMRDYGPRVIESYTGFETPDDWITDDFNMWDWIAEGGSQ